MLRYTLAALALLSTPALAQTADSGGAHDHMGHDMSSDDAPMDDMAMDHAAMGHVAAEPDASVVSHQGHVMPSPDYSPDDTPGNAPPPPIPTDHAADAVFPCPSSEHSAQLAA